MIPSMKSNMAEGGKDQDNNPFSFKSFVSKKDTKTEDSDKKRTKSDEDIFDSPNNVSISKRDRSKQIIVIDEDDSKGKTKKKSKSENPFSFKKFLSTSSSKIEDKPITKVSNDICEDKSIGQINVALPNIGNGDLPDFVQDHYIDSVGSPGRRLDLPDFTHNGNVQNIPDLGDAGFPLFNVNCLNSSETDDLTQSRDNASKLESDDFDIEEENVNPQCSLLQRLPDFLSETCVGCSENIAMLSVRDEEKLNKDDKNEKVLEENQNLRREVEELKAKRLQDVERIKDLECQLVNQKKKEADETKAMEHAMEQVEQNLSTTTTRAIQAESTVSRLKQEIKALQTELKTMCAENGMTFSSDQYLSEVKERTDYAAKQLSVAALSAETSLRQLLSGVDNLKLLSQVLSSIDKISEETVKEPKNSTDT